MPLDHCIIRISKEIGDLQKTSDLCMVPVATTAMGFANLTALAVACRDIDVRNVRAMIIGPHETPYQFGFFEFAVSFGDDYPSKAPSVTSVTTDGGRCRFNPNIYANGKVCLSILGTWRGESGEQWSSAQGLESILLSIQSLMSSNPYENEPGFENPRGDRDKKEPKSYADKIQHESLHISVIQRLEGYLGIKPNGSSNENQTVHPEDFDESTIPFEPFKDLCKRRFLWYFESYLAAIQAGMKDFKKDQSFTRMPFESQGSNSMDGKYIYPELEKRLHNIKTALDKETQDWANEGLQATASETTVSVNLKHQFEQITSHLKQGDMPHDLALEGGNPFVWIMTYFGRPMTNLDGGICRVKISFSPRFPDEQPRVKLENRIFHHLVASDGTICYNPRLDKREDVRTHVEAVIAALEDDDPAYDPRKLVNPEASQLFWNNGKDGKRQYNRRLRRSVEQSMEDFAE